MFAMSEMTSLFIWYHGQPASQQDYLNWLVLAQQHFGIQGRLLIREEPDRITYMEIFEQVEVDIYSQLERLAADQACFHTIERHCEAFKDVM